MKSKININGIEISLKHEGTGPDMILIHGLFASKEIMNPLYNHYKNSHHVLSYDVRGHGESEKPEKITLNDHADDLAGIIEHFDMKNPVVIGLSMGSYITLTAAEKYPELFSKIVLIGTKGQGRIRLMEKAVEENGGNADIDLKEMGRLINKRVFPPNTTMEQIKEYYKGNRGHVELTNDERKIIYESLSNFDMISDASKVKIPALLLVGEYDGLNPPEESQKVFKALPNAKLEVIEDAGHIIYFEKKDEVISLIDSFIND